MEIKEIPIQKGEYLAQIYPLIESNIILNKKLSGVGATHCEIVAPRNSIIIVPNTPIITCKVEKHGVSDNLLGVMQNVSELDIIEYLKNTIQRNKRIKIIVTPESFHKVRRAFNEIDIDMYDSCFMMLDECHKFIKERDFREDIVLPMDSFFKFKNKALVSATPLLPSDPRFSDFKLVKVVPQYNHRYNITIIPTDDIRRAFMDDICGASSGAYKPKEPQCVFVNSASIIADLINQSDIHKLSSIFCSEKSAVKLKQMGFINVHTEWKEEYQKPFMFFTSRFFTGLDILLKDKPRVYYFSDAINAEQTLMDPETDMAQACGRFRNGMIEIFHYVVCNPDIKVKSQAEIEEYICGIQKSYEALQTIYDNSESQIEREAILNSIKAIPFNEIFTTGEIDYFLKDNIVHFELLRQKYRNPHILTDAYCESDYFGMAMEDEPHIYAGSISNITAKRKLSPTRFKQRQREAIVEVLDQVADFRGTSAINDIINTLKDYDKTIVDAYFKLGRDYIIKCDYNIKQIKDTLSNQQSIRTSVDVAFLQAIYDSFVVGQKYLRDDAKKMLRRIYEKFNVAPPSTITAMSLKWHFDIDEKARIGNHKAVLIIRRKVQGVVDYFNEIKHNTETKPADTFDV